MRKGIDKRTGALWSWGDIVMGRCDGYKPGIVARTVPWAQIITPK
jgi:hypothetical protein